MHHEKNICKNLVKILLDEKNKPFMQADLQASEIRLPLHLRQVTPNSD